MPASLLVVATLAGGLLIGLIPTLVDGLKKPLDAKLNLPGQISVWFVRLFYLAWLPAMPAAGSLLDVWNSKEILFLGLIALILGITWLALARSASSLLLTAVFLGAAYACVTVATVRLMTQVFFPDYAATDKMNLASLNLGFVMVGAGAMIGPWVVQAIDRWWGYRQGLLYLATLLIVPAALTALCDRSLFPKPPADAATWESLYLEPHMLLLAGVILLYFALENFLEYWPEAFLKDIDYRGRGLQLNLIIFWLAFIGTRAAAAWWLYHHPSHGIAMTMLLVVLSGCVLGNLAGGFDVGSSTLGFWLVGACYGPVLPGLLGLALDFYYPQPLPLSALGTLLALSGLDTLVLRPIMDTFAQGRPARMVMRLPAFLAIIIGAPLLLLAFLRN
jgi:MFS family permease